MELSFASLSRLSVPIITSHAAQSNTDSFAFMTLRKSESSVGSYEAEPSFAVMRDYVMDTIRHLFEFMALDGPILRDALLTTRYNPDLVLVLYEKIRSYYDFNVGYSDRVRDILDIIKKKSTTTNVLVPMYKMRKSTSADDIMFIKRKQPLLSRVKEALFKHFARDGKCRKP